MSATKSTPPSSEKSSSKSSDITVVARIRPIDEKEEENSVQFSGNVITCISTQQGNNYEFAFDAVLGPKCSQLEVFEKTGLSVVDCVLDGFNSTIFAYGQTGAGKTHTMLGTEEDPGIIVRFAHRLFEKIEESSSSLEYSVQTQYVEIYLERVRDLLEERSSQMMKQNLQIREDVERGVHIPEATIRYVCTAEELLEICEIARINRATSETLMNQVSSRSHSVLILVVTQKDLNSGTTKSSKINLVDLAGSEAIKRTGAEGDRLSEAQAINSSLSAVGNVIHALTNDKSIHIPYRDSKLTRLLQESLGGNAKTWLIVNISPSKINISETIATLRFGQRAKFVKNRAVINRTRSVKELEEALTEALNRIASQEEYIAQLRNGEIKNEVDTGEENLLLVNELNKVRLQLEEVTRERDEARIGWEKSRELAASIESEIRQENQTLREQLEAALAKIANFESFSETGNPPSLVFESNLQQRSSESAKSNSLSPSKPSSTDNASISSSSGTATLVSSPTKKLSSEVRLDQLISVHRQLLRKYAALELNASEIKLALSVSEDRIKLLTRELASMNNNNINGGNYSSPQPSRIAKVLRGGGRKQ